MAMVMHLGESYECATAIRGDDYIHLLDAAGKMIAAFDGITEFSDFSIDGDWTEPTSEGDCFLAVIRDDGTVGKGTHRCSDVMSANKKTRNLLDNSNFAKPVNQRGQEEYEGTNVYTIDRWLLWSQDGKATLSVKENCVTVDPGETGSCTISQRLVKGIFNEDESYTFALYMDDGSIVAPSVSIDFGEEFDCANFAINTVSNIVGIAIYEGNYTIETMPPYVPKGEAAELLECQRYFVKYDTNAAYQAPYFYGFIVSTTNARFSADMPTAMRTTPTLTVDDGISMAIKYAGNTVTPTELTVLYMKGNKMILQAKGESMDAAHAAVFLCYGESGKTYSLRFSADL